ncbi:MAG TPA: LysR family transcriptional regulator [Nannocystaceae bacterium]|nr:LysR family transcriptional regulator [Nannocystaceae bacterium]
MNTPPLDLNLLLALDVLLEERNVTRAAARLGLTQSAMSHKLKKLRELLDDPVLVPGGAGLVETERARRLGQSLRRGLEEIRAALHTAESFDPATSRRTFTVVSSDFSEIAILPRVYEYISKHAPNVSTMMREPFPGLMDALDRGDVDLIMGPSMPERSGLVQRRVSSDVWMCAVRLNHPRVKRKLDLGTYLSLHHLVINPTGSTSASPIDVALERAGKTRHVSLRIPHFLGAPFIVASSELVVTAPRSLLVHAADVLPLRIVEPPIELPPVRTVMTWHERTNADPAHAWLRELSARCTREVVERRR